MKGIFHPSVGTELTQAEWESEAGHNIAAGTSFPESPVEKDLFYRTDEHKWYVYNGTAWDKINIKDASEITSGRFGMARMPDGTDGYVLTAKGAGIDPAYEAAGGGSGLIFTELAGAENHQVTNTNTWEDWDLSAIVPAGAVAVLVEIYLQFNSNQVSGARKNGSALARYQSTGTPSTTVVSFRNLVTEVDDNRIIEIYGSVASSNLTFSILGYWA